MSIFISYFWIFKDGRCSSWDIGQQNVEIPDRGPGTGGHNVINIVHNLFQGPRRDFYFLLNKYSNFFYYKWNHLVAPGRPWN